MKILHRHAAYLDVISVLMRMRHHKAVSRAELIRALIDSMEQSGIDFSQFATAQEMIEYLTEHFRGNPHRGALPLLVEPELVQPEQFTSDESPEQHDEEGVLDRQARVNANA